MPGGHLTYLNKESMSGLLTETMTPAKPRRLQPYTPASVCVCVFVSFLVLYNGAPLATETFKTAIASMHEGGHQIATHTLAVAIGVLALAALLQKLFLLKWVAPPGTILGDWLTMRWFDTMIYYSGSASMKRREQSSTWLSLSLVASDAWWARFDGLDRSDQGEVERRTNEVLSGLKCDYNYKGLLRFDPVATNAVSGVLGGEESLSALIQAEYEDRERSVIDAHTHEIGAFAFADSSAAACVTPFEATRTSRGYTLRRELRTIVVTGLLGYHATRRDMREWYQQEWQHTSTSSSSSSHLSHALGPHSKAMYTEKSTGNRAAYTMSQLVILQDFFRSDRGIQGYGGGKNGEEYDAWLSQLTSKSRSSGSISTNLKDAVRRGSGHSVANSKSNGSMGVRSWGSWVRLMEEVRVECEKEQTRFSYYRV